VAALDATEKGHTGLASYYTQRCETPGVWVGSGMDGIDGLTVGDPLAAEQMQRCLAAVCIRWPSCGSSSWKDLTDQDFQKRTLGHAPRRSLVTTLTFSPVKSVSTLWAVADAAVAAAIERAHQDAVQDALTFIETHALFTRTGPQGIRQVNVRGLVATAFTHRDSRAGDPDLHTHVAVANKVQTLDGRWLSIDGRVLFKANVAASETYNTALEQHLRDSLGVRFAERPGTDPAKRPIREIVGVDPRLNQRWSTRRTQINTASESRTSPIG
jgi:conjugative relaxase-like TrwC/TraI family protein